MGMPRVMIAAPGSGSGKTIITCGLLSLLKRRGADVASYKCGPDYIDPMFHRKVIGVTGGNLDTFFSSDAELRAILDHSGNETAVIEGVMGIYDGIAGFDCRGSCYDVACATDTPVILVMDVKGMGQTMISVIKGILADDTRQMIRGIILNRMSDRYYREISPCIEEALDRISEDRGCEVRLLGGIPNSQDIHLESRHLGLMMPDELEDLKVQIGAAERLIQDYVDLEALEHIMESAGDLQNSTCRISHTVVTSAEHAVLNGSAEPYRRSGTKGSGNGSSDPEDIENDERRRPVLAVARDEAFCFYYEENLRMMSDAGIRIQEFSPLHDSSIPVDADGLLLGGGYPELYADQLSSNRRMLDSIRSAIDAGMPSLAECGGFMYLMDELEDKSGNSYPMAGIIPGRSFYTGKLRRFGYVTVTAKAYENIGTAGGARSLLEGLSIRGHEFHYFDSNNNGRDAVAVKPGTGRRWECMHAGENHIWGYPHLYYPSCPELVKRIYNVLNITRLTLKPVGVPDHG